MFKLRRGVTFHDGAPMEAADVVVVASARAGEGDRLAAREPPRRDRERDARSMRGTVEVKLKEPSAPLLDVARDAGHRAARASRPTRTALQSQPVGTGPFKFQEWQPNGFIALTSHDGYWKTGIAEARGRQVQHRSGIGDAPGRRGQRPVCDAAEHRRGDGPAAQGQAECAAARRRWSSPIRDRHERLEAALQRSARARGLKLRAQPAGDRAGRAVRRRRAGRSAVASAQGLGGRREGISPATATAPPKAHGAAQGRGPSTSRSPSL